MSRIYQEFYCASSGGGCGGYITVRINMAINGVVEVVCPKCNHKHQRRIKNGALTDDGRHSDSPTQDICPTIAAWSKEPQYPESKRKTGDRHERVAQIIETVEDKSQSRGFLRDRIFEIFGGR